MDGTGGLPETEIISYYWSDIRDKAKPVLADHRWSGAVATDDRGSLHVSDWEKDTSGDAAAE
jgi:hypothetical protein